jgi:hypothetical protein
MNDLQKLTSLWKKTSKKGDTYLVGRLGDMKVLVMANKQRQPDSDEPTHVVLIAPRSNGNGNGNVNGEHRSATFDGRPHYGGER